MEPSKIQIVSENDLLTIYKDGELVLDMSVDTDDCINIHIADELAHWWLDSPEDREESVPLEVEYASAVTERDLVLNLIRQSYRDNPSQGKPETAAITKQIARKVYGQATHKNVMRVAGYRAAISRGVYDKD